MSPEAAAALLGGLGGALAAFMLGGFREWWREEREREALLRLLLAEIDHNAEVQLTIGETTDDPLGSDDFRKVSAKTWRESQGRAAALLPSDLFASLNGYDSPLQTLLTLLAFEGHDRERLNRGIARMHSELFGREFARSRNPWSDYRNAMLKAQERARTGIARYLALRWDDRLLQRVRSRVQRRQQDAQV